MTEYRVRQFGNGGQSASLSVLADTAEQAARMAYSDGSLVTVLVEQIGGQISVHDAGLGAMRLSSAGISITNEVSDRLNREIHRFRCTFSRGRVTADADMTGFDALPSAIALAANASRSVADYTLGSRRHTEHDFREIVFDQLREIVGSRMRENEEFKGRSGRRYRVPALLLDESRSHPEHFVGPLANRQLVSPNFAMFFDLHGAFPNVHNEAIYDDAGDFRDEDRSFLRGVCDVIGFMEAPLKFRQIASPQRM